MRRGWAVAVRARGTQDDGWNASTVKVWLLSNTLVGGGAEKQMLLTAALLAKHGIECEIVCLSPPLHRPGYDALVRRCRADGISIRVAESRIGLIRHLGAIIRSAVVRRKKDVLWTWGYRAEAVRLVLTPLWLLRAVVSIRSANIEEIRLNF